MVRRTIQDMCLDVVSSFHHFHSFYLFFLLFQLNDANVLMSSAQSAFLLSRLKTDYAHLHRIRRRLFSFPSATNRNFIFSDQHNTHTRGSALKYVDVIHRPEGEPVCCVNKKIRLHAGVQSERESLLLRKILNVIAEKGKSVEEQRIHTRAIEICCKAWRHARERMRCAEEEEVNRTRERARKRTPIRCFLFVSVSLSRQFRTNTQSERGNGREGNNDGKHVDKCESVILFA
jgi:hypothetical protein